MSSIASAVQEATGGHRKIDDAISCRNLHSTNELRAATACDPGSACSECADTLLRQRVYINCRPFSSTHFATCKFSIDLDSDGDVIPTAIKIIKIKC